MNMCLKGFRKSKWYKRDLSGWIELKGEKLSDTNVRLVINKGIENGYEELYDIPDELAEQWIKEKEKEL